MQFVMEGCVGWHINLNIKQDVKNYHRTIMDYLLMMVTNQDDFYAATDFHRM